MVPSMAVQKIPFELWTSTKHNFWTSTKHNLRHLYVWGCQTKIRIYNLQEKKWMQEQSVDISLVIYQSQKGICFTILPIVQKLLKLENARFIENVQTSGSETSQNVEIKEVRYKFL